MAHPLNPDAQPVRVLIVDDETLMRAGLRLMVDGVHGIDVVAEACDGQEAVDVIASTRPDVVLMDVRMPRLDGLEATKRLMEKGDPPKIVVLTAFDTDDYVVRALEAGAVSFLLKDSRPEAVIDAVLGAARDEPRFSPRALRRLVNIATTASTRAPRDASDDGTQTPVERSSSNQPASDPTDPCPPGITEREWEVAQLVADGLTNTEIAQRLYLSLPTVKTHVGRLFEKLSVTNRVQLAVRVLDAHAAAQQAQRGF